MAENRKVALEAVQTVGAGNSLTDWLDGCPIHLGADRRAAVMVGEAATEAT